MNLTIKTYLDSFKFKKVFGEILLIDLVYFGIITALFTIILNFFQNKFSVLTGGKTPEQVQQLLATASPEQLLPFLSQLKFYLILFLIVIILLSFFAFFSYSFSQSLIWHKLLAKKPFRHWRWNLLNLTLIIPILLYSLAALLIKFITGYLFKKIITLNPAFYLQNSDYLDAILTLLNGMVTFLLVLLGLIIILLTYFSFTEKNQVWISVGDSFHLLKLHWRKIWKVLLLAALTAIIITLILIPIKKILPTSTLLDQALNLFISAFYLAWIRVYLIKAIHSIA
ncbi:MAG TPA: hypothetical protein VJA23_04705 [Candidatus Nanoarchaeia archaeon]|nr:hypothetical protein [Candidatus Nanoarchaeia archaeon]